MAASWRLNHEGLSSLLCLSAILCWNNHRRDRLFCTVATIVIQKLVQPLSRQRNHAVAI